MFRPVAKNLSDMTLKLLMWAGALHVLGRFDLRRKRNGVWIDIKQIESVVEQHPFAMEAAIALASGKEHMDLYFVASDQTRPGEEDGLHANFSSSYPEVIKSLRAWVQANLPVSSIPNAIHIVREIPKSPAGKILRTQLGSCTFVASETEMQNEQVGALTEALSETEPKVSESVVLAVFRDILKNPTMEPISNFFAAGGTSLLASLAASILQVDASLIQGFPSARELSRAVSGIKRKGTDSFAQLGRDNRTVYSLHLALDKPSGENSQGNAGSWIMKRIPLHPTTSGQATASRKRHRVPLPAEANQPPEPAPALLDSGAECVTESSYLRTISRAQNTRERMLVSDEDCLSQWHRGVFEFCCVCCSSSSMVIWKNGAIQWGQTSLDWDKKTSRSIDQDMCQLVWSGRFEHCVDAPPALVRFASDDSDLEIGLLLACSHGGQISCFQLENGQTLWSTLLEDHTDGGLAITGSLELVAVSCGDVVCFLRLRDGQMLGSVSAGGAVKSAPTVDPWGSYMWATSHGNQILVIHACRTKVQR